MADSTLIEIIRENNQGARMTDWDLNRGSLPLFAQWFWKASNYNPKILLITSSMSFLLSGVVFAFALIRLGCHRWMALVCPALLPTAPVLAFAARRWDMHAPSLLLIASGLWVLAWSKGFTRLVPSLVFSIVLCVAAFFSPRETDNFLLLLGLCSLALGFGLSSVLRGRWLNEDVSRVKALVHGSIVVVLSGVFILTQLRFTSPTGAAYYLTEASHQAGQVKLPWNHSKQLMGYISYLFWRGWGSVLSVPAEIALIWLLLRRRLNWGLFVGFMVPLVILSVLPKKNYYYSSIVWAFPALFIPLALSYLPKRISPIVAFLVVFLAFRPYWARAYPASDLGLKWKSHSSLMGSPTWDGILQTSDQGLSHVPALDSWPKAITERLTPLIPNDGCRRTWRVMLYGVLPMEELQLRLAEQYPCVDFQCDPPYTDLQNSGIVMLPDIGAAPLPEAKAKMKGQGMTEESIVVGPDGEQIYIYRRPDKWFSGRGSL